MPIETSNLPQKAVVLAKTGRDLHGVVTTAAAKEVSCRWEISTEQIQEGNDKVVATSASVVVDQEVAKGSVMWLGKIIDFKAPYSDLHEVYISKNIPDLKGRHHRRVLKLIRFTDRLPELT